MSRSTVTGHNQGIRQSLCESDGRRSVMRQSLRASDDRRSFVVDSMVAVRASICRGSKQPNSSPDSNGVDDAAQQRAAGIDWIVSHLTDVMLAEARHVRVSRLQGSHGMRISHSSAQTVARASMRQSAELRRCAPVAELAALPVATFIAAVQKAPPELEDDPSQQPSSARLEAEESGTTTSRPPSSRRILNRPSHFKSSTLYDQPVRKAGCAKSALPPCCALPRFRGLTS
eukprot:3561403-Prymnesium_polylepis.1